MTIVWSYGGGTQSIAIAVLVLQEKLPRPDHIVIADTGRERRRTWEYLDRVVQPALKDVGLEVKRIRKEDFRSPDLYNHGDDTLLIPAFTDYSGKIGKLPTFCSKEWKSRVVRRYMTEVAGVPTYTQWLGFSVDELERMKHNEVKSITNTYPLIDLRFSRANCAALVESYGWPSPPKSACWMCPNRADPNWKQMKDEEPDEFERAVVFEREIQKRDPHVWLHGSGKPLGEVVFDASLFDTFLGCDDAACMT